MSAATGNATDRLLDQIIARYDLAKRLHLATHMLENENTRTLLRSHLDKPIVGKEVTLRDNLDFALAGLSMLHIAGMDRIEDLPGRPIAADDVLDLVKHKDVRRYYEVYYPFAPPILLRESLEENESYRAALQKERAHPDWASRLGQFMALDAVFNAPGPMQNFLALLDDYLVNGVWLSDLRGALSSTKKMERWLAAPERYEILEGMQDFLAFSEELDDFLDSLKDVPLFRGLVWLTYGYWYGGGGPRMRKVANWLLSTLDQVGKAEVAWAAPGDESVPKVVSDRVPEPKEPVGDRIRTILVRLTDMDGYPGALLEQFAAELKRWKKNSAMKTSRARGHIPT